MGGRERWETRIGKRRREGGMRARWEGGGESGDDGRTGENRGEKKKTKEKRKGHANPICRQHDGGIC